MASTVIVAVGVAVGVVSLELLVVLITAVDDNVTVIDELLDTVLVVVVNCSVLS